MTKPQLRAALRRQRKLLRRTLADAKREQRARVRALTADERRRRRRLRLALLIAILLLILSQLQPCSCGPGERGVRVRVEKEAEPASRAPPLAAATSAPLSGKKRPRTRPNYDTAEPQPLAWIERYRLQVLARSPRLAECFVGAERPGALRWSAAVEPRGGVISDHVIEAVGDSGELSESQRSCLEEALATPRYQLIAAESQETAARQSSGTAKPSTPVRIGIVIEF